MGVAYFAGETAAAGSMGSVITAMTTTLTADKFFGVIADCVPYLGIIVPVALGLTFLRRLVRGSGRGKVSV